MHDRLLQLWTFLFYEKRQNVQKCHGNNTQNKQKCSVNGYIIMHTVDADRLTPILQWTNTQLFCTLQQHATCCKMALLRLSPPFVVHYVAVWYSSNALVSINIVISHIGPS